MTNDTIADWPTPHGWPATIRVERVEQSDSGWQLINFRSELDAGFGSWGTGIPPVEYCIQEGDTITLYFDRPTRGYFFGCKKLAFQIKDGPIIPFPDVSHVSHV